MSDGAPSEKQVDQGIAALEPFVRAWDLPLNPEELGEMAYAVLTHVLADTPTDGIREAVEAQIAEFAEASLRLRQHQDRCQRRGAMRLLSGPGAAEVGFIGADAGPEA